MQRCACVRQKSSLSLFQAFAFQAFARMGEWGAGLEQGTLAEDLGMKTENWKRYCTLNSSVNEEIR